MLLKQRCDGRDTHGDESIMTVKNIDGLDIPDGLEFGVVETDEEQEQLIEFNVAIHGDEDGESLRRMIECLPGFGREMNYYIRESDSGKIVSSLNSIPSVWSYEGIPLRNLELGFVGTTEEYRRKGLVALLYQYFDRVLREGNYDISTIMGVPFFYRQFDYDFIIPLGRSVYIRPDQIPDTSVDDFPNLMSLKIRHATTDDIPHMIVLYEQFCDRLLISSNRSKLLWEQQETNQKEYAQPFSTYVLEDAGGIVGYFRVTLRREKDAESIHLVDILESSIRSYPGVLRALVHVRDLAKDNDVCNIALPGTQVCNMSQVGLDLGGQMSRGWRYQVRIPDVTNFLKKAAPILKKRLEGTMYEFLTREFAINTYRDCYVLRVVEGQITSVENIGFQGHDKHTEFRSMRQDFVRLLLGHNSVKELSEMNSDFIVSGRIRGLVETLFPKKESHVPFYHC